MVPSTDLSNLREAESDLPEAGEAVVREPTFASPSEGPLGSPTRHKETLVSGPALG